MSLEYGMASYKFLSRFYGLVKLITINLLGSDKAGTYKEDKLYKYSPFDPYVTRYLDRPGNLGSTTLIIFTESMLDMLPFFSKR